VIKIFGGIIVGVGIGMYLAMRLFEEIMKDD